MYIFKKITAIVFVILLVSQLSACGQEGPLYLPPAHSAGQVSAS